MPHYYIPDKKDIKIIEAIADNGRFSYSGIGKKIHISKDRVRDRLKNLIEELFVLSFFPIINYEKLGYSRFYVLLRFTTIHNSLSFLKKAKSPHLMSFTRIGGGFDYELQMIAKNKSELIRELKRLGLSYPKTSFRLIIPFSLYYYTMHIQKSSFRIKELPKIDKELKASFDKLDLDILKILSDNSRTKLTDMSYKLHCSEDTIRYRIKSLIKRGIIVNFYSRTNKHRLKLNTYILLLELNHISKQELDYLSSLENVYYIAKGDGKWNLIINFYAESNTRLVNTLDAIRGNFKKNLPNFRLFILLERYEFNPFPKILSKIKQSDFQ